MSHLKILFFVFFFLISCSSYTTNIIGIWTQPISGIPNQEQGILLEKSGKASSINMHTLVYTDWKQTGKTLYLMGESLGNHQNISFTEKYIIEKLTADTLILKNEKNVLIYYKREIY